MQFATDPDAYLPVVFTRWQGIECYNYSALDLRQRPDERGDHRYRHARTARAPRGIVARRVGLDAAASSRARDGTPVANRVYGAGHKLRPRPDRATEVHEHPDRRPDHRRAADVDRAPRTVVEHHRARAHHRAAAAAGTTTASTRVLLRRAHRRTSRSTPATTASRSSPAATSTAGGSTWPRRTSLSRTAPSPRPRRGDHRQRDDRRSERRRRQGPDHDQREPAVRPPAQDQLGARRLHREQQRLPGHRQRRSAARCC